MTKDYTLGLAHVVRGVVYSINIGGGGGGGEYNIWCCIPSLRCGSPNVIIGLDEASLGSFYGSPRNLSLTKSPVLKPAPGRVSSNTASLETPTWPIDRPLHTRKYVETFLLIASLLVSSSHETFVKGYRWSGGGLS